MGCESLRKRVLGRAQRPTFLVVLAIIDDAYEVYTRSVEHWLWSQRPPEVNGLSASRSMTVFWHKADRRVSLSDVSDPAIWVFTIRTARPTFAPQLEWIAGSLTAAFRHYPGLSAPLFVVRDSARSCPIFS